MNTILTILIGVAAYQLIILIVGIVIEIYGSRADAETFLMHAGIALVYFPTFGLASLYKNLRERYTYFPLKVGGTIYKVSIKEWCNVKAEVGFEKITNEEFVQMGYTEKVIKNLTERKDLPQKQLKTLPKLTYKEVKSRNKN